MPCKFLLKLLTILLLTALPENLWSQQEDDKEIRITGSFRGISTTDLFKYLENNYYVRFFYKEEWFRPDTVNVVFNNVDLEEAVNTILHNTTYTFRIIGGNKVVLLPRAQVAVITGQIPDFTGNKGSDDRFEIIGSLAEAGKHKTATIRGKVIDGKTGETIIGAIIEVENLKQGAVTNVNGNYRLTLKTGLYTLAVTSIGFEKALFDVKLLSDGELNIELFEESVTFADVIIYGNRPDKNVNSHQMSLVEMNIKELGQLPSIAGGKDVLKALIILPGVKSVGEFSSGINVRGGGEDQNLYLYNSAPLFNTMHVFGMLSIINPDAVEKLSIYKGNIPASYGERVSSVIDIRSTDKSPDRLRARGGIGLYDSRLMIEAPIIKDTLFFSLGGRTSYSNWLLKMMEDYYLSNSRASFYDLNVNVNFISKKSRITLSGYTSADDFRFAFDEKYNYKNYLGSVNWNYRLGANLGSYLTFAYSGYDVSKVVIGHSLRQSSINSAIKYGSLKYRLQYGGLKNHNIEAGFSLANYRVKPGSKRQLGDDYIVPGQRLENEQGYEGAVFINDEVNLNDKLLLNIGLRYSAYANTGPGTVPIYGYMIDTNHIDGFSDYRRNEIIQNYQGFEPRISARMKTGEAGSIKISYNRNLQYISLLSYSGVSSPADLWKLADPFIKPLIAAQYSFGIYRNFRNNSIETSLEIYYKGLKNVIDYKDGAQLEMNDFIETQLIPATGRNYGAEFLLRKNSGRFDGWLTYTYSRSLRKTNGWNPGEMINNNEYYPSSYDRPHDLSITANYHMNRRIMISAYFSYATGRPITLPEYRYNLENIEVVYFSDRNKYRIPSYHRLDLTFSLDESLRVKKKWKGSWSFSILNVYGRKNPYSIFYSMEQPSAMSNYERFSLYSLYLIGQPVPTISYSFIF